MLREFYMQNWLATMQIFPAESSCSHVVIVISILQMMQLRLRELETLLQGQTVCKW